MLEKLHNLIYFPATPVISFVAIGIFDHFFRISSSWISFAVCCVLFLLMVVSTIVNFSDYGKFMKYTCVILCAFTALCLYTEMPSTEDVSSGTYYGNGNISFTGNDKCNVCKGKGTVSCNGGYCNRGTCTACKGGLYDHGSYVSECRVCGGDAKCNTCEGDGRKPCWACR